MAISNGVWAPSGSVPSAARGLPALRTVGFPGPLSNVRLWFHFNDQNVTLLPRDRSQGC